MDTVYLDHNATTPPDGDVVRAVADSLTCGWGNPSSLHAYGQEAARILDTARARTAALVGVLPGQVVFTSGGTEANNQVLLGLFFSGGKSGRHVVVSGLEHQAVLNPCELLEAQGWRVTRVAPGRDGVVSPDAVAGALCPDSALVSIMLANNETGVIQPVQAIAESAHARGVPVHTDAVQAVGKVPVSMPELGVDFLSFSAHKLYGPKGVGALCFRNVGQGTALLLGGHQEQGRRGGTENLAGIAGFGKACELAVARLAEDAARVRPLRDRLEAGIKAFCPDAVVHGDGVRRLPNTSHVSFPGVESTVLALNLDLLGMAVSTGSACTAASRASSHVLLAMGVPPALALSAVRFSLGRGNSEADIDRCLDALRQLLPRLRARS